ncbi:hypothetical protein EVS84_15055 [Pseudomonas koreensis]|uniref:Uncharacterized protein n=2 Tax=Pseudomonas TaxID=286 RepID=A0A4Q4L2W9_9PSED|nr:MULTISPECIES: hypothetical protein [Pseudomonas]MDM8191103.1 hypothetical protein [Pseudomonas fluorescens]MDP8572348.1 hypothetical protein [Pseudomonas iranensis]RYM41208.1 hypothetical protein EVS84_15055 [Pseudomonas koreensis]
MQINITNVLKDEVTISGQIMKREYVENIMLPVLIGQCGTVRGRQFDIVKIFDEAGLSLAAIPEVAREYAIDKSEKARLRLRQQAEADAHAERCRIATPRELAQAKADRVARAAAIREQGAKVLAARSRNAG